MKALVLATKDFFVKGSSFFSFENPFLWTIYNKPLLQFSLESLQRTGVHEVCVCVSRDFAPSLVDFFGGMKLFGLNVTYKVFDFADDFSENIASLSSYFGMDPFLVLEGNSVFFEDFSESIRGFSGGAHLFFHETSDSSELERVSFSSDGSVSSFKKDFSRFSPFSLLGVGIYDAQFFSFLRHFQSEGVRGFEILSHIKQEYLRLKQLSASRAKQDWFSVFHSDSLLEASLSVQERSLQKTETFVFDSETKKVSRFLPKVIIGVVTHNSEKYIRTCLSSLLSQDYPHFEIVVLDNASCDNTREILKECFPQVRVLDSLENYGFARSHNEILRSNTCDFYACVNIDIVFELNFVSELVRALQENPLLSSVGGKIKRWDTSYLDFENADLDKGKTNILDSVGIRILKSHRFEDLGQGEVDCGQYDEPREIFGVSGAAVLYRRKALDDISYRNNEGELEFFDESMFLYKEDVDLAYRLQWAGWKSFYSPKAVCYHDRTVFTLGDGFLDIAKNRSQKSKLVNRLSYRNHNILLFKNFSASFGKDVRFATYWYNLKVFLYLLVFETSVLAEWPEIFKLRKYIQRKKRSMPRRVLQLEIEKLMEQ